MYFGQALNMWNAPAGSSALWLKTAMGLAIGVALIFALIKAPTRARGPITAAFIFVAGAFWVVAFLWPKPAFRGPNDLPDGFVENVGFWISDAVPIVNDFTNILVAFILGLGIFSLARIHVRRLFKMQPDWPYSLVLLISMIAMIGFGYATFYMTMDMYTQNAPATFDITTTLAYAGKDFLFDGMLQEMEAGMFSIIAFFILSAAYRAFRIRSIESTILLAAALLMILSLLGALVMGIDNGINSATGGDVNNFLNNLKLSALSGWVRDNIQTPSIRAMDFGIGLGTLAMGLRLWLSLEKTGGTS
ncbi:MAG: hypothetical protein KF784_08610 [Fimbriimonadaceae bacterium]|nr:hypothetical protein [Fimbriimonadaceae bacterium]